MTATAPSSLANFCTNYEVYCNDCIQAIKNRPLLTQMEARCKTLRLSSRWGDEKLRHLGLQSVGYDNLHDPVKRARIIAILAKEIVPQVGLLIAEQMQVEKIRDHFNNQQLLEALGAYKKSLRTTWPDVVGNDCRGNQRLSDKYYEEKRRLDPVHDAIQTAHKNANSEADAYFARSNQFMKSLDQALSQFNIAEDFPEGSKLLVYEAPSFKLAAYPAVQVALSTVGASLSSVDDDVIPTPQLDFKGVQAEFDRFSTIFDEANREFKRLTEEYERQVGALQMKTVMKLTI